MSVHVMITFHATPDGASALADLLHRAQRDLPGIPGCRGAILFRHRDDPALFTLMEEWDSELAHRTHLTNVVASGAWAAVERHLTADPVSRYLIEL